MYLYHSLIYSIQLLQGSQSRQAEKHKYKYVSYRSTE